MADRINEIETEPYEGPERRRSQALPVVLIVQIVLLIALLAGLIAVGANFRTGQDADRAVARALVASDRAACERHNATREFLRERFGADLKPIDCPTEFPMP